MEFPVDLFTFVKKTLNGKFVFSVYCVQHLVIYHTKYLAVADTQLRNFCRQAREKGLPNFFLCAIKYFTPFIFTTLSCFSLQDCLKEVTQELFCTKRFALEVCHLIDSCDASQYRSKTHCLQYEKKKQFSQNHMMLRERFWEGLLIKN